MPPVSEVPEPIRDLGATSGVLTAVLGMVALIWTMTGGRHWWSERRLNKAFQRQFREDWLGEPARDGVPARAGVMVRLSDLAADGMHLSERVRKLERDLLKIRSEVTFLLTHRCPGSHADATGEFTVTFDTQPPEDEEG